MNESFSIEKAIHVLSYLQQETGVTHVVMARTLLCCYGLPEFQMVRIQAH